MFAQDVFLHTISQKKDVLEESVKLRSRQHSYVLVCDKYFTSYYSSTTRFNDVRIASEVCQISSQMVQYDPLRTNPGLFKTVD